MSAFGDYIRSRREILAAENPDYGVRRFSYKVGISPTYLSRMETGKADPPSEKIIDRIAHELGEDPNVLFTLAGKIPPHLVQILLQHPGLFAKALETMAERPKIFAQVIDELAGLPDHAIIHITRTIRDGDW